MTSSEPLQYLRLRWPEEEVPADSPVWFHYEVDRAADLVLRMVEIYADGRVTRDSIEIEERDGATCPSLIEDSCSEWFDDDEYEPLSKEEFEEVWSQGVDTPFWFPDGFPKPWLL